MRDRRAAVQAILFGVSLLAVALLGAGCRPLELGPFADRATDDAKAIYTSLTARATQTADLVPVAHTDVNRFAVNVFLEQEVEEWKIRRTLEMVRDGGFRWIKQQVRWADIETPAKGQHYDTKNGLPNTWDKYDRIVDLARGYGLDLILRLDTSPQWARAGNAKEETPPDRYEDYADFVYEVVSRYRGKVKYYQIWNEPNLPFEWGGKSPNATAYVRLLSLAHARAKEADPHSVIISAALAPTIERSERGMDDLLFTQQMYDAGASQFFDVMGANAYGLRSGPDDRRLDELNDVNFSRPLLLRELMVRNADSAKPIWISEMGWNALPEDFPGEAPWGRVTREQQAEFTVRAYQRIAEEWPWVGVAALWHFRMVHDVNRVQPLYYFAIVDNDFSPTPAYEAIKRLASRQPLLHQGYHPTTDPAFAFQGAWQQQSNQQAVLGTQIVSQSPGAGLSFDVSGGDVDLIAARSPQSARLLVSIDGGTYAANRLPLDANAQAYVDLWSSTPEWRQLIPLARGLPWGRHEVMLRVTAGPNSGSYVALDGVQIAGGPPNAPRTFAAVLLPLLTLLLGYGISRLPVTRRVLALAAESVSQGLSALGQAEKGFVALIRVFEHLPRHDDAAGAALDARPILRFSLVALAVILGWFLRLFLLNGQSFWYDEGTSAAMSVRSLPDITIGAAGDIHPPLYYYFLHLWAALAGTTEFALRLLSAAFGLLAVSLTYAVARLLFGVRTGVVAALLAAISPVLVYYSQEARMYAQLTALAALSLYLFGRLVEGEDSPRRRRALWAAYLVTNVALLYTHYFALPVLLGQNIYFVADWLRARNGRPRHRVSLSAWLAAQALPLLLFLPWLIVAREKLAAWPSVSDSFGLLTLLHRLYRVFVFGIGWDAASTTRRELAIILPIIALCLYLLFAPSTRRLRHVSLLAIVTGTPVLVMYALSFQRAMYNPKFLLPSSIGAIIVIGAATVSSGALAQWVFRSFLMRHSHFARKDLRNGALRVGGHVCSALVALAALSTILYPTIPALRSYYLDPKYARDDYRGLVAYVTAHSADGDSVILNAPGQVEIFKYYYQGTLPVFPLPTQRPLDQPQTAADLATIVQENKRIWLVEWAVKESDPANFIDSWFAGNTRRDVDLAFGTVRLLLYVRDDAIGGQTGHTGQTAERAYPVSVFRGA